MRGLKLGDEALHCRGVAEIAGGQHDARVQWGRQPQREQAGRCAARRDDDAFEAGGEQVAYGDGADAAGAAGDQHAPTHDCTWITAFGVRARIESDSAVSAFSNW